MIRPEGFPAHCRVKRRAEFLALQRTGRRHGSANFVMFCGASSQKGARLGITVSSRVGTAVVRNRIKRWIRETYRRELRAAAPGDAVVIARPSAAELTRPALAAELRRLFARAQK